ncbi:MAG: clostripain-related cysteine peptidase, partial [Desulfurobacteriaceae bacterium]
PSSKRVLILWNHGDAWRNLKARNTEKIFKSAAYDETSDDLLYMYELKKALENITDNGTKPFDVIGFDECLMGEFTTLTLLKDYANVIVASPEYELGDGWGDVWGKLPTWYEQGLDTWTIAKNIVDGYIEYWKANPPYVPLAYPQDIGLTAIKTTALESLRQAFEQFAGSLYQTALNEVENGQLYEVFYSFASNSSLSAFAENIGFWGNILSSFDFSSDVIAVELDNATSWTVKEGINYHSEYGGSVNNRLGYDLLYLITRTGLATRLLELGATPDQAVEYLVFNGFDNPPQYLSPSFDNNTVQNSLNFLNVYNQVKANDELYTRYLNLDMQGGYNENVVGSGLSLIYPYTSPAYASSPKLELCNFQNFVESYNSTLPNYTNFVKTVFGEMWKAFEDTHWNNELVCDDVGNLVDKDLM